MEAQVPGITPKEGKMLRKGSYMENVRKNIRARKGIGSIEKYG
jgi:hypothetical protein